MFSNSFCTVLCHDFLDLPLFLDPWEFHSRDCWVMFMTGFLKVCPIHPHFFLRMVTSTPSCFVHYHKSSFEILLGHQIPMMYRSLQLMNVWSLEMILSVNLQVSDPYRRTALTFELKIFSLVYREMHLDLQTGLNMQKAACAFLNLASTSSSVLPVVDTRLPRCLKAVTCSRTSSPQVMFPVFAEDRILIFWVFDALTLSPTLAACSWSASSFCLTCAIFWLSNTRSSAKSRSSSFCNKVNWIPVLLSPKRLLCYPVQCHKEEKGAQ